MNKHSALVESLYVPHSDEYISTLANVSFNVRLILVSITKCKSQSIGWKKIKPDAS